MNHCNICNAFSSQLILLVFSQNLPQDITGEASFMKTSAEKYDAKAKETKSLNLRMPGRDGNGWTPEGLSGGKPWDGWKEKGRGERRAKTINVMKEWQVTLFDGGLIIYYKNYTPFF